MIILGTDKLALICIDTILYSILQNKYRCVVEEEISMIILNLINIKVIFVVIDYCLMTLKELTLSAPLLFIFSLRILLIYGNNLRRYL